MAEGKSQFEVFLAEQIEKYRGVAFPVYTPWLWRKLVRKVNPKILHPNPEDEFCDPRIGPNTGSFQSTSGSTRPRSATTPGIFSPKR